MRRSTYQDVLRLEDASRMIVCSGAPGWEGGRSCCTDGPVCCQGFSWAVQYIGSCAAWAGLARPAVRACLQQSSVCGVHAFAMLWLQLSAGHQAPRAWGGSLDLGLRCSRELGSPPSPPQPALSTCWPRPGRRRRARRPARRRPAPRARRARRRPPRGGAVPGGRAAADDGGRPVLLYQVGWLIGGLMLNVLRRLRAGSARGCH